jgi:CBS domain-containing protein
MRARDLMTPDPKYVTPDETVVQAAALMRQLDIGMLPVVDTPKRRRLIGIVTDRDLVVRCQAEGHSGICMIGDHMSLGPFATVLPDATAEVVIEAMARHQVRRLPVLDADGTLRGVITQGDVAVKLGPVNPMLVDRMLERISHPGALVP